MRSWAIENDMTCEESEEKKTTHFQMEKQIYGT